MQGHVVDVQLSVGETDDLRSGRRIAQIVHGQLADVGDQQAAVLDKHALRSRQIAVGGNQHARDGIGEFQHIPFSFGIERVELARPETAHEQLSVRRKSRLSEPYPVGQHGRRRICLSFGAAGQRPSENREKKAFFHIVFFLKVNYLIHETGLLVSSFIFVFPVATPFIPFYFHIHIHIHPRPHTHPHPCTCHCFSPILRILPPFLFSTILIVPHLLWLPAPFVRWCTSGPQSLRLWATI